MPESSQLDRRWKIRQSLKSTRPGNTVQDVVSETVVIDKAIRRDLKPSHSVFYITESAQAGGIEHWQKKRLTQPKGFSFSRRLSLHFTRLFEVLVAGTPFWDRNRNVFKKANGALGEKAIKRANQNAIHMPIQNTSRYPQERSAKLLSTSVGASDCQRRRDLIDGLMVAIEELRTIKAHFAKYAGRCSQESITHKGQNVARHPDGSLIATFRLPNIQKVKRWITFFRFDGSVLKPHALVQEIFEQLRAMVSQHDADQNFVAAKG